MQAGINNTREEKIKGQEERTKERMKERTREKERRRERDKERETEPLLGSLGFNTQRKKGRTVHSRRE
jgi:hypothetical protein